ncbi:hypothetical protein EVAR_79852_1 [Eumeta japonica]|uniref:Uncharacterized protein n=1 Tax=Eumeta variegata TaxID=151549 RepID=A0A4C1TYV3_EUMVA|nr:hypothetical protein EVAR_79852_1 [Eumeta japonica]
MLGIDYSGIEFARDAQSGAETGQVPIANGQSSAQQALSAEISPLRNASRTNVNCLTSARLCKQRRGARGASKIERNHGFPYLNFERLIKSDVASSPQSRRSRFEMYECVIEVVSMKLKK